MSDYFLKLTGYTRDEVIEHTSVDLNIWGDVSDRERVMEMLQKDGVVRELDILFRSRGGEACMGGLPMILIICSLRLWGMLKYV